MYLNSSLFNLKMDKISLGNFYYWIGFKTATHPVMVIIIPVILICFILSGLIFLDFEVTIYFTHLLVISSKTVGIPGIAD